MSYSPNNPNYLTIATTKTNDGQKDVRIVLDVVNNTFYSLDDDGNFNPIAFEVTPEVYVYRALLSQAGAALPTVTVLQNDLNITPVWTYDSPGYYFLNLTSAAAFGNITLDFKNVPYSQTIGHGGLADVSEITVRSFANSTATNPSADGIMFNTLMEVLIFPI